jgi:hypothetical protein
MPVSPLRQRTLQPLRVPGTLFTRHRNQQGITLRSLPASAKPPGAGRIFISHHGIVFRSRQNFPVSC